jgi:hypothetical protein
MDRGYPLVKKPGPNCGQIFTPKKSSSQMSPKWYGQKFFVEIFEENVNFAKDPIKHINQNLPTTIISISYKNTEINLL